jgi:hypothetical protein
MFDSGVVNLVTPRTGFAIRAAYVRATGRIG